jgi:predicted alpha-1,2-mannosidase
MAYEALKKNHMPGGIMDKAGYEHNTNLGGGLNYYIGQGYVPYPIPEGKFGYHQNGPSLTLEYAYQDWCLAQFAKALGKQEDYGYFMTRSKNYKNVYDPSSGWMRPKNQMGEWLEPYDPYKHGAGFSEANGAQNTWFVPHDLEGLAELMGGNDKAIAKLNHQFEEAKKLGFTIGTSIDQEHHPEYSRIPINYGNQPSIQTAFIFQHLGRPDLTQYWVSQVVKTVYEELATGRGYNGDEDQGLMGSLAVLMKIGLFQMTGTELNPVYQITGSSFNRIEIELNKDYYEGKRIVIEVENYGEENCYIKSANFDNNEMKSYTLDHEQLVGGGTLKLEMSSKPK